MAVEAFTAYADGVKLLHGHLVDLKKSISDALGKAGFAAQSLVEACEEAGLASKAISLRSVVGRTQAALIRKMVPDLDSVLLSELNLQLAEFKDLRTRITKRLDSVAEANHYRAK